MKEIKCNLCNSNETKLLFKVKDRLHRIDECEFRLVKCTQCGLVYINPQPTAEELVKYYPDEYAPYNTVEILKYGPMARWFKSVVCKKKYDTGQENKVLDQTVKKYLDFGCGGGDLMAHAQKNHPNWIIEGLDNNEFACQQARAKGFITHYGSVEKIELPKSYYDIINVSHVIEHLADPMSILLRLKDLMKTGGEILVSTPNFDSWAARAFKTYWYATDAPRHLFLFTPATLQKMLNKVGFQVSDIHFNPGPKVFIRSIYHLCGRKDMGINPILWRLFEPISEFASIRSKSSIMTVRAVKI